MTADGDTGTVVRDDTATSTPRISPKAWFLLGTIAFFAAYLQMAFGLEWRTQAGRIGPGYFPRVIGILAIVLTMIALANDLRSDTHEVVELEDEVGDAAEHLGRHPRLMTIFAIISAAFVTLLPILGSILATALYLAGTLTMLDRTAKVRTAIISIAVPVVLYLAFDTLLNAGLPGGFFDNF